MQGPSEALVSPAVDVLLSGRLLLLPWGPRMFFIITTENRRKILISYKSYYLQSFLGLYVSHIFSISSIQSLRSAWKMLSSTCWDFWSCPMQGQELDVSDPCGFLPTQDILWLYNSIIVLSSSMWLKRNIFIICGINHSGWPTSHFHLSLCICIIGLLIYSCWHSIPLLVSF